MKTFSRTGTGWRLGSLLAVVAAAACDGGTVAPADLDDTSLNEAVAVVSADAALEDLAAMSDMLPGGGPMAVGGRSDLVREREVTFFDAAGEEQDGYDPLLTASIHSVLTMEGEVERDNFSASLSRHRDMWVTGLEGEETTRTFNGEGSESHSRTRVHDELGTRTFAMEAEATIQDVVRAVDRQAQPWPLSGTITRTWQVVIGSDGADDIVRQRTVVITFDGTQFALLTVDGDTFQVDLAARANQNPIRGRHNG